MRIPFLIVLSSLLAAPLAAQQKLTPVEPQSAEQEKADKPQREIGPNEITQRAVARAYPLVGEWRVRYIFRQLDLTPSQREAGEGLIETVLKQPVPPINLGEVRRLMAEMQMAKEDGDKAREAQITKQIRELGKKRDNEPEFIENLRLQLTDEQKKKLDAALARLKINPSGHLRPVDVFDMVDGMKLTEEQKKKLHEVREELRKKATTAGKMEEVRRAQMMRTLVRKVNPILDEKQRAVLDSGIEKLRTDRVRDIAKMDAEAEKAKQRMSGRKRP